MGGEHALATFDGEFDELRCIQVPMDVALRREAVLAEVAADAAMRGGHDARFNRPS